MHKNDSIIRNMKTVEFKSFFSGILVLTMAGLCCAGLGGSVSSGSKVRLTYIDTLNTNKEIGVSGESSSRPQTTAVVRQGAVAQTVASAGGSIAPANSMRYRIQCVASADLNQMKEEKKKLEAKCKYPVSIKFESPYYKMMVGEFATRDEAETAISQVRDCGYPGSWIVSLSSIVTEKKIP